MNLRRLSTTLSFALGLAAVAGTPALAQSTVDRAMILKQNDEFYASFRDGDLERMKDVWSSTREIGMIPPGRGFLQGRKRIFDALGLMMLRPPELTCEREGDIQFRNGKAIVICIESEGTSTTIRMMNVFAAEEEVSDSDERDWRLIYHGPVPDGWEQG